MANDYDLIIIGGGCAGLSLASRLAAYGSSAPKTLVLDGRSSYGNDRTWCFWQLANSSALDLVEHRWLNVSVASEEREVHVDCRATPYCAIPARRLYASAIDSIDRSPMVSLQLNSAVVGRPRWESKRWSIETPGYVHRARSVVDTRPVRDPQPGDALLWQSFSGVEIEGEDCLFDTERVVLMDFRNSPEKRILFTYILPFSPRRALVEVTEFSPAVVPPGALRPFLLQALQRVTGGRRVQTLREEAGILPMGQTTGAFDTGGRGDNPSYVLGGVAGGGARACTGYAFQRIQRWSERCAAQLVENGLPLSHPRDPVTVHFLDSLFLNVLRDNPNLAPRLFAQLFASAPAGAVLRFLSDLAAPSDIMSVIAALPPGPFFKTLAANCVRAHAAWRESFVG